MELKEAEAKLTSLQTKLNETTTKQSEAKTKADRGKGAAKTANLKLYESAQVEINQLQQQVNALTDTITSLRSAVAGEETAERKSKGKKMSCLACGDKPFNGFTSLTVHAESEKHQKNLRADLVGVFRCGVCTTDFSTVEDIKTHMTDSQHLQTAVKMPCDICGIVLNSESQYTAHISSKKHINKQNKANAPPPGNYRCSPCKVTFTSDSDLQTHYTTSEHVASQAAFDAAKVGKKNKRKALLEKKRASKKAKTSSSTEPAAPLPISQESKQTFSCEPCAKTFTSAKQQEAHTQSKGHLKKVANGDSANPYANTQV
jgi:hypothetical protein